MTRAQTKLLLESGVLQAYAEGKTIQLGDADENATNWTDWNEHKDGELMFNSNAKAYRVKPEPRHFWILPGSNASPPLTYKPPNQAYIEVVELLK